MTRRDETDRKIYEPLSAIECAVIDRLALAGFRALWDLRVVAKLCLLRDQGWREYGRELDEHVDRLWTDLLVNIGLRCCHECGLTSCICVADPDLDP